VTRPSSIIYEKIILCEKTFLIDEVKSPQVMQTFQTADKNVRKKIEFFCLIQYFTIFITDKKIRKKSSPLFPESQAKYTANSI